MREKDTFIFPLVIFIVLIAMIWGCNSEMKENKIKSYGSGIRNINAVLTDHTDELMAIPGVVGLFVGETAEKIPCIHVMVVKKTEELEKKIPKKIEGHLVIIEETGEIKPLKKIR
jgi:hypothetical protein